jgi:hypothetical protein
MRRFFMLIPEAVQLVLHAASQAESGATYVLEMGEQVKVLDMARDMIRLSGLVPDEDIKIEFVGLRPGEKLFEELVGPDEDAGPSVVEKVLCVRGRHRPPANLLAQVRLLELEAARGHTATVVALMKDLVAMDLRRPEAEVADTAVEPVSVVLEDAAGQSCPKCPAGRLVRSHAHSIAERARKQLTAQRLFRCEACGWRGWLVPNAWQPPPVEQPTTQDLSVLDYAIAAPHVMSDRPSFSPRDLS